MNFEWLNFEFINWLLIIESFKYSTDFLYCSILLIYCTLLYRISCWFIVLYCIVYLANLLYSTVSYILLIYCTVLSYMAGLLYCGVYTDSCTTFGSSLPGPAVHYCTQESQQETNILKWRRHLNKTKSERYKFEVSVIFKLWFNQRFTFIFFVNAWLVHE